MLCRPQNHGISGELINGIHEAAHRFFSLADEDKMKVYVGNSKVRLKTRFPWNTGLTAR